jgi:hypothetical protein
MAQMPLLDQVLRVRHIVLAAVAAIMLTASVHQLTGQTDWRFFSWGSDLLIGMHHPFPTPHGALLPTEPGGLHLYGNYAFLQIGPPALLLAALLQVGPGDGLLAAGVTIQALGLVFVYAVDRAFPDRERPARLRLFVGGTLVTVAWGVLTHFRHLDDALTLAALAAGVLALTRRHPAVAGALMGLAAASKPWGIPLLALVLVPTSWRSRFAAACAAVLTAGAFWAPFVVADHDTLRLGEVVLQVASDSPLRALGVSHLGSGQSLRLLQLGVGLALACAVVLRGRWPLAPLAAFSLRLMIEPSTYPYYPAAVVAAAFLADAGLRPSRPPVLTALASAGWVVTDSVHGSGGALARLVLYGGLLLGVAALLTHPTTRSGPATA